MAGPNKPVDAYPGGQYVPTYWPLQIPMACIRYRNRQTSSGLKLPCFMMNTAQGGHNLSIYPAKLIRDEV